MDQSCSIVTRKEIFNILYLSSTCWHTFPQAAHMHRKQGVTTEMHCMYKSGDRLTERVGDSQPISWKQLDHHPRDYLTVSTTISYRAEQLLGQGQFQAMGVKVGIIKPGRKHTFSWDIFFQRSQSTNVKWAEDLQKSLWRASQRARFKVCCTVSWLPFFNWEEIPWPRQLEIEVLEGSRVHDQHSGEHFNKQVGIALEQYLRTYSWSPSWKQR